MNMTEDAIVRAADILDRARCALVLTGAGISAESGIPTFRQAQTGLWEQFTPQDLATPEAFAQDPERVWAWYHWRRTLIARGGVNAGHRGLVELATRKTVALVTQNVDGLHQAAGSQHVIELHGNIWHERCTRCEHQHSAPVAESTDDALLLCPQCGAMTRPGVVWFGETLPAAALYDAQQALERADCVLVVGTSNRVYPAAAFVDSAVQSDTPVIEINPEATGVSSAVDCHVGASASLALPALVQALDALPGSR